MDDDMKIFNEILDKHTKMYNCKRESYMINNNFKILISKDVIRWLCGALIIRLIGF